MNNLHFTQEQLTRVAKLTDEDMVLVKTCRGQHNKLGCAYQLCYVKLFNRLPAQSPFVAIEELATFVAVQLDIPVDRLIDYASRQVTFSRQQEIIRGHLQVEKLHELRSMTTYSSRLNRYSRPNHCLSGQRSF